MKSLWMLAAAQDTAGQNTEGTVVTMEEAPASTPTTTTTQSDGTATAPEEAPPQPNPLSSLLPFLLIIVVMYLFLFRGPKKKQQEHQKMVASLKKNDRVRTIGGILGTVLDIRDDEVVLKIDESTNAKIRIVPSAIATVLNNGKAD
jgi:preprotein translocase subunit YajC